MPSGRTREPERRLGGDRRFWESQVAPSFFCCLMFFFCFFFWGGLIF